MSLVPVFADLLAAELDEAAGAMREVDVEAGTKVVTVDDYGTAIYFIEQGEAEVLLDGGEATRSLGPGDTFGEIALVLTGERTATVVARTPIRLLSLSGQDFDRIRALYPSLNARYAAWASSAQLGRRTRVCRCLKCPSYGPPTTRRFAIAFPTPCHEVSQSSGTGRSCASSVLEAAASSCTATSAGSTVRTSTN
jgi:CRP-like cAMP-binding protein